MRLLYCQQPLSRALGALMRPGKERSCGRPMPGTIDRRGMHRDSLLSRMSTGLWKDPNNLVTGKQSQKTIRQLVNISCHYCETPESATAGYKGTSSGRTYF